ncbi:XRE family transcriptional regulator [Streptomyces qinzhouensis]|uniref:XRE family transcriptional regulator n=1 Tax=Streptomyces qinzhouensis TaxID=2599401 RepID=UPI001FE6E27E|nr:XRE family transcriptional regulator [Streptomyces qinzhouensis]
MSIDLATVQGWESGRRPLGNTKAVALLGLRRRLSALGAAPAVLGLLDPAMEADQVISAALDPPDSAGPHPLGLWVHNRDTAHLLACALTGTVPQALAARLSGYRRMPSASAALLRSGERTDFFEHLRETADAAHPGDALLRRQAFYLVSYDRGAETASWTAQALLLHRGHLARRGWSEHWAQARSTAAALARLGDPQPLLDFIDRSLIGDDTAETANLNYWAYWLGGIRLPQSNDLFMQDRGPIAWDPIALMRGLVDGLPQAPGYVDLYTHTLWALLTAHPWLPQASPVLATDLTTRIERLIDGCGITPRVRRELAAVHYLLRDHT